VAEPPRTPEFAATEARAVAGRILGVPVSDVDFTVSAVSYVELNPVSAGVRRVAGTAATPGGAAPWSAVVKTCARPSDEAMRRVPPAEHETFNDVFRWDREPRAYESGLLDELPDGVAAPRCFGITREERSARIWLEDLGDDRATWDAARYALAARHLGRLGGAYLAGRPHPRGDWLSRDWIRRWTVYFTRTASEILADDRVWSHRAVVAEFDPTAREDLCGLVQARERIFEALDELPRTFTHMDAFRANMVSRGRDDQTETVLLDWANAGIGPLGADLAHLVVASIFYYGDDLDPVELEALTIPAFAAGLADVGYRIDQGSVEHAYAVNAIARMSLVLGPLAAIGDPVREQAVARAVHRPFPETVALLGARTRYLSALSRRVDLD